MQIVIVSMATCLACFDLFVYLYYGTEPTLSAIILEWSQAYPILPFVFGVLCGHLFWPQYLEK